MNIQQEIHNLELKHDWGGAALMLLEHKFYQVGRASGMLSRLPLGSNGNEAMRAILQFYEWNDSTPWPIYKLFPFETEQSAAHHYLTFYAPREDRIYVARATMDAYKGLGGGQYPGEGNPWGMGRAAGFRKCRYCGNPANWMGVQTCETCQSVIERLPKFMKSEEGRAHVLRAIGMPGLREICIVLQGEEDAHRSRDAAADRDRVAGKEGR